MVTWRTRSARAAAPRHPRLAIAKCANDRVSLSRPKMLRSTSSGRASMPPSPDAEECSALDFVTVGKYAHAAATMTYDAFAEWWGSLAEALRTPLPTHVYDPANVSEQPSSKEGRAEAVAKVLGVRYDGKYDQSWFFQEEVLF